MGAFLMFHGSILGERTTGIATLVVITGCGIICMHACKQKNKEITKWRRMMP